MHAVVRNYSGTGAKELADVLEKRKGDVESIMRGVKGFCGLHPRPHARWVLLDFRLRRQG